jgi:hypothetical protein
MEFVPIRKNKSQFQTAEKEIEGLMQWTQCSPIALQLPPLQQYDMPVVPQ